jgi:hypothetical protein
MSAPYRLVSLSGSAPEALGAFGVTEVIAIIGAVVAVATAIVPQVTNKRAREAADIQNQTNARVQANIELDSLKAALEQRNATVQEGFAKMLDKSPVAASIVKYGPVALVGGALILGTVAMRKGAQNGK